MPQKYKNPKRKRGLKIKKSQSNLNTNINTEISVKERNGYESLIIKSKVNQIWRWDTLEDATEEVFRNVVKK